MSELTNAQLEEMIKNSTGRTGSVSLHLARELAHELLTLRSLVEQLAGACEAAIKLSDKYLDSAGRTKECQKVYDMNATALAAAAAYRKERP